MTKLLRNQVIVGDAQTEIDKLPANSVDTVITSSPYFLLRDYGVKGQIGLESTVDEWADELRVVMRGISRVLKPTGSVWLNLGDSYSRHSRYGATPKSLLLGPERVALALVEDGWILRNRIAWTKTNSMPNSVKDRFSCTWEVVYFLVRSKHYFFDLDAVRLPTQVSRPSPRVRAQDPRPERPAWAGPLAGSNSGLAAMKASGQVSHPLGKNPGDVISTPASNYRGAHFATFPEALIERPLLAGCPERVCSKCGVPWEREQVDRHAPLPVLGSIRPRCTCTPDWRPGLVLDPFFGAGTVGVAAERLGRDWLGIELNPAFAELARQRIGATGMSDDEARGAA
jgi:site-specific DNA-methyltransferase (adenine-specific)